MRLTHRILRSVTDVSAVNRPGDFLRLSSLYAGRKLVERDVRQRQTGAKCGGDSARESHDGAASVGSVIMDKVTDFYLLAAVLFALLYEVVNSAAWRHSLKLWMRAFADLPSSTSLEVTLSRSG